MTERPIRVAVVGVGDFGRNHVRVYSQLEGTEPVSYTHLTLPTICSV